jgi:putative spermidine/putrescine transport system permease protein
MWQLGPALLVIVLLFGGGLFLGLLQALGQGGMSDSDGLTTLHFRAVIEDPDFFRSLGLTLYISTVSTLVAGAISVLLGLTLITWAPESRLLSFILQIPLTVPHLVIAVSVMLLLAPAGFLARILASLSLLSSPSDFPLLVNDSYGIGILVVYIWKEIPFITFMLLAVLKNIGPEILQVGATLKANRRQRFFHIVLPLIGPNLAGACLIVFAFTFGAFEVPYLLGRTYPLTLPVWAYKNYTDIDLLARPEGIAIGLLIAGIIICAVVFSQFMLQVARNRGEG